jgi:hypothetical protein
MKRSIIGLLLAIPMLSIGQSKYQKGYVVNSTMDTLKGFIDYKAKASAVPSISFRKELNSEPQTFTPTSAKGYGIDRGSSFESFSVRISNEAKRKEDLKVGIDTSSRRATVFLKVLQRGPNVNIYSYTDEIKERFYVKRVSSKEPYELVNTRYIEGNYSRKVVGADRYKGQLLFEMKSHNAGADFLEADFDDLAYTETEMIEVGAMINSMEDRLTRKNFRFFAGAGVGGSSVKYTGQNPLANDGSVSETSYMPSFNVGIDLAATTLARKIFYRAELSLFMGKETTVTRGQYIHSFDHTTLYLSPKILYNAYNTTTVKIYAGFGVGASYSTYSNNISGKSTSVTTGTDVFDEIKTDLKQSAVSYNLNVGFAIKKIEVTAMYTPYYKVSDYAAFIIRMGIVHAGIKYRFD